MREIVYVDDYFLVNFLMDLTALFLTGLILSEKAKARRYLIAALFGGAWSLVPLLAAFPGWATVLFSLAGFPVMPLLVFGVRSGKRFGFACLFFLGSALFLGGTVEALSYFTARFSAARRVTLFVFLAALALGATAWNLWGRGMRRRMDTRVVSLSLTLRGETLSVYGLVDSGSLLREPITGDPVILLKAPEAAPFFEREEMEKMREGRPGKTPLFAVPVRGAAGSGVLFAFRPDGAALHHRLFKKQHKKVRCLVALDFGGGAFAGCPALIPLNLL